MVAHAVLDAAGNWTFVHRSVLVPSLLGQTAVLPPRTPPVLPSCQWFGIDAQRPAKRGVL